MWFGYGGGRTPAAEYEIVHRGEGEDINGLVRSNGKRRNRTRRHKTEKCGTCRAHKRPRARTVGIGGCHDNGLSGEESAGKVRAKKEAANPAHARQKVIERDDGRCFVRGQPCVSTRANGKEAGSACRDRVAKRTRRPDKRTGRQGLLRQTIE